MYTYDNIIATVEYHIIHPVQLLLLFVSYLVVTAGLIYIFKKKIMSKYQRLLVTFACIMFLAVFSSVSIYNFSRVYLSYADVDLRAEVHGTFTRAIREGDLETIQSIMLKNPKLNNKDCLNQILLSAVICGHNHIVEYAIINGADVDFKDYNEGWSPLHHAVISVLGEVHPFLNENKFFPHRTLTRLRQTIETLIKYEAEVNARDEKGRTPLGLAVDYDLKEIVSLLRKHGAVE